MTFGEMLGYLPVIFFGAATPGPMHSVAILFWVLLFPDRPGQMTAFGFVSTISLSCSTRQSACYFSAGRRGRFSRGRLKIRRWPIETKCSEPAPRQAERSRGCRNRRPNANEDVHAERNEVKNTVVTAELAFAKPAVPVNPVGIDEILGKGRGDQNWQDPWKGAAEGARKQAAGDKEKVGSVIEGPA